MCLTGVPHAIVHSNTNLRADNDIRPYARVHLRTHCDCSTDVTSQSNCNPHRHARDYAHSDSHLHAHCIIQF